MPRFRLINLLFLTAVAAVYLLIFRVALHGAGGAWAGWAVIVSLISWRFYSQSKADVAMMHERDEQEKRVD